MNTTIARESIEQLLAIPDPPDFTTGPYPARRGHHVTQEGSHDRFQLLPYLSSVYVQDHLVQRQQREEERVQ